MAEQFSRILPKIPALSRVYTANFKKIVITRGYTWHSAKDVNCKLQKFAKMDNDYIVFDYMM
jgi:hypothetical protein